MKTNVFRLIASYLGGHKKTAFLLVFYAGLNGTILFLYQLPAEPVLYAFLIFCTVLIIFAAYDISKYYIRHKQLAALQKKIHISIENLPIPSDLLEKDYQDLIEIIHSDKVKNISEADSRFSDLNEYYIMWVHQIKTPITAMHLLLQSENKYQPEDLFAELFKIEHYIEMILQYTRLKSNSSDFVFKTYPLDDIIRSAVKKYAKFFITKKISLHYSETNYIVLTDEKWLSFVFEQLLSNALKYTNTGYISIHMDKEGILTIEDTGIGIAEEDLPRIFEQGYTGYNGRQHKKSTGIGLFLCRNILNKLSHEIQITSKINHGTKVIMNLSRM